MFGFGKKEGKRSTFLIKATDRFRKVTRIAQQKRRHTGDLSDESLLYLLGMIKEGSGVGLHIIINYAKAPHELYKEVKHGLSKECNQAEVKKTNTGSDIINCAVDSSKSLGDNYVGTEHLLLGMLSNDTSIAGHLLKEHGLDFNSVKDIIDKVRVPQKE
jgi:ATP-dependent Clp protease ATP-binding subunit ClpC